MGLLRRRLPLYARPFPFVLYALLALVGTYWGLNWDWQWSLQTGHIFILIVAPNSLLSWGNGKALLFVGGLVSIAAFYVYGTVDRRSVRAMMRSGIPDGWRRPAFRFYPLTFLFGLFVLYYGIVFLFDASVYGDRARGASVAFIYLDYAGLMDRPFVTFVGLCLIGLGLACTTLLAFSRGLGLPVAGAPPPVAGAAALRAQPRASGPAP